MSRSPFIYYSRTETSLRFNLRNFNIKTKSSMEYRYLGNTGLKVSALSLGSW